MWDQRFSRPGFAYGTEPNDFLADSAEFLPPRGRVVCLAEGEGRNAVFLAERGHDVVAVDSSAVGLEKAAQLARRRGVVVETVIADLADYHIAPQSCDAIVSIFCHLQPAVQAAIHRQVYQGLRPGGVFLLEGYSIRQLEFNTGGPKDPALLLELETVKEELRLLTLMRACDTERLIHEGDFHNGRGAVIQIIGVKN